MNIKIFVSSSPATGSYYLSPINWFLRLYHEKSSKSKNDYNWLPPMSLYYNIDNYERIKKAIIYEQIDVIGFSLYVWNRDLVFDMCEKIKYEFNNLTIIIGGPDVDAHVDNTFFNKHPYIDYAIYGDGEEAFSNLLDFLISKDTKLINVVEKNGNLHPHAVFSNKDVMNYSPYITYKDEIISFIMNINRDLCEFNKKSNELEKIMIVWETTKGCPYACSFCDWSSGLHNKVRIWGKNELIPNWQKEIDLFFEIQDILKLENMYVYWTNPNVGLTLQDEEIVNYWCKTKEKNKKGPMIFNPQLSKLKKDKAFMLLDKMVESNVTEFFKFDVQDLDPIVLDNINRPEIPWPEHKKMIINIKNKHKDKNIVYNRYSNRITFMWGLPGQTLAHMKKNMIEAGSLNSFASHLPFEILPNTPAAKKEYIDRYKLKITNITIVGHGDSYAGVIQPDRVIHRAVIGNYSLSVQEWHTGMIIFYIYNSLLNYYNIYGSENKLFDNMPKMYGLINDSYIHFEKTHRIELILHGKPCTITEYVNDNRIEIYNQLFND